LLPNTRLITATMAARCFAYVAHGVCLQLLFVSKFRGRARSPSKLSLCCNTLKSGLHTLVVLLNYRTSVFFGLFNLHFAVSVGTIYGRVKTFELFALLIVVSVGTIYWMVNTFPLLHAITIAISFVPK
jgi:hypothetical protein